MAGATTGDETYERNAIPVARSDYVIERVVVVRFEGMATDAHGSESDL